jgi:hypothetical protein
MIPRFSMHTAEDLLPAALKQTSAEPLACSVRLAKGEKSVSGRRAFGRAAAQRHGASIEHFRGSAAPSSHIRGSSKEIPVVLIFRVSRPESRLHSMTPPLSSPIQANSFRFEVRQETGVKAEK